MALCHMETKHYLSGLAIELGLARLKVSVFDKKHSFLLLKQANLSNLFMLTFTDGSAPF